MKDVYNIRLYDYTQYTTDDSSWYEILTQSETNKKNYKKALDDLLNNIQNEVTNSFNKIVVIGNSSAKNNKYRIFKSHYNGEETEVQVMNYVGVLKYYSDRETATVEIGSRFDKDNPNQEFLIYMLSKVYEDISYSEKMSSESKNDNIWDLLLVFLFKIQLIEAYRQGLFKTYRKFEYNDSRVRGQIDVSRHIKRNIPFIGSIAYCVSENTYDNSILHLIRHAFERLKNKYTILVNKFILNDNTCREALSLIEQVTPTFYNSNVVEIVKMCKNPIVHPFFNKYEDIRKTSIMILKDMGISIFNASNEKTYGILININWLWERFLGKEVFAKTIPSFQHVISNKETLLEHIVTKVSVKDREFDFLCENIMVVDAKYKPKWQQAIKSGEKWTELSNDINQVLTYCLISNVKKCGVAFPVDNGNGKIEKYKICVMGNDEYMFYTIPIKIPIKRGNTFKSDFEQNLNYIINKLNVNLNY